MSGMKFQSLISDAADADSALTEVIEAARAADFDEADVAFVFLTAHHREEAAQIVESLWLELDTQAIIGCSCEGVLGGEVEIERAPGLAVLAGQMPGVRIHPFHIGADEWRKLLGDRQALASHLGVRNDTRALIGVGDPFTSPMTQYMSSLDTHFPGLPLIGGLASSGREPGTNVLVRNDGLHDDGFVGVSLSGASLDVRTLVSQGCRPIGRPMVITKARDNVIEQLGGKPAVEALRETVMGLTEADQSLLQNGLFVGRAMSEYRDTFRRGDFVIRNLMRVDQDSGVIAVADFLRVGQTVQFHVRDAATAHEDLQAMLTEQAGEGPSAAAGGLLFTCNGRGTNLFEEPSHDIRCTRTAMPDTPVAGFFAAGELGPVGGKNFMHGHTTSYAFFRRT
jgi:small ligand-binding sensory domain FIST